MISCDLLEAFITFFVHTVEMKISMLICSLKILVENKVHLILNSFCAGNIEIYGGCSL